MKVKVGDIVYLREDLEVGKEYGLCTFAEAMKPLVEEELKVREVSDVYFYVEGSNFKITEEMVDYAFVGEEEPEEELPVVNEEETPVIPEEESPADETPEETPEDTELTPDDVTDTEEPEVEPEEKPKKTSKK